LKTKRRQKTNPDWYHPEFDSSAGLEDTEMTDSVNPNSALHWLNAAEVATEHSDVKTLETKVVEFGFMDALPLLEGENPKNFPHGELDTAACDLGWPVFIRTDLSSAKHDGASAVRAADADDVLPIASGLVSDAAKKMMRPAAFLVREWIDIDHSFTAFGGLPIGTEIRVFAGPDDVLCSHYYWPEDAIKQPDLPEWKEIGDEHAETSPPPEVRVAATSAATKANRHEALDDLEVWSVDFARAENGDWYLIDMALAAESWHPDCDYASAPEGRIA
jgi:hypothetical protein